MEKNGKHKAWCRQYVKDKISNSFSVSPILEFDVKEEML